MEVLWHFMPMAPQQDHDAIRLVLCRFMIQHQRFGNSLGLVEQIENPLIRTEARSYWIVAKAKP